MPFPISLKTLKTKFIKKLKESSSFDEKQDSFQLIIDELKKSVFIEHNGKLYVNWGVLRLKDVFNTLGDSQPADMIHYNQTFHIATQPLKNRELHNIEELEEVFFSTMNTIFKYSVNDDDSIVLRTNDIVKSYEAYSRDINQLPNFWQAFYEINDGWLYFVAVVRLHLFEIPSYKQYIKKNPDGPN